MKKRIVIIEPCFFGLGYVEAAHARGYEVVPVVSSKDNPKIFGYEGKFHDLILADIRSVDSIIGAIESYPEKDRVDAIMPGCSYVGDIAAVVAEHFGKINVGIEAAKKGRYKNLARSAFDEAGIPNAKFATVTNFTEAKKAAEVMGYPLIVKPTNCDSSQNVMMIGNEKELVEAFHVLDEFKTSYLDFDVKRLFLIEEYIVGPEFSVEIFLSNGEPIFSSVTEKETTPPPYFAELMHVVPTSVHKDKVELLTKAGVKAMKAIGLANGPSHVEMRLSSRGPIIMEINPRPAGDRIAQDLMINAYGVNIFDLGLDFYLGLPVHVNRTKKMSSALATLVVNKSGKVKEILGFDAVDNTPGIVKKLIKVKPGDMVYPPTNNDYRYGYIISVADNSETAKNAVQDALKRIKIVCV